MKRKTLQKIMPKNLHDHKFWLPYKKWKLHTEIMRSIHKRLFSILYYDSGHIQKILYPCGHWFNSLEWIYCNNFPESSYLTSKFSVKLQNRYGLKFSHKIPQNMVKRSSMMDLETSQTFYLYCNHTYKLCKINVSYITIWINNN